MTTLDELREQLEKAEGPDRELDVRIEMALVIGEVTEDAISEIGVPGSGWTPQPEDWPPYTASLDAAIALVEAKLPGWLRLSRPIERDEGLLWRQIICETLSGEGKHATGDHKSEPIALLLALLSALEKESAE